MNDKQEYPVDIIAEHFESGGLIGIEAGNLSEDTIIRLTDRFVVIEITFSDDLSFGDIQHAIMKKKGLCGYPFDKIRYTDAILVFRNSDYLTKKTDLSFSLKLCMEKNINALFVFDERGSYLEVVKDYDNAFFSQISFYEKNEVHPSFRYVKKSDFRGEE